MTDARWPFRLQTHRVTVGRLGPIYRALETATGRVLTVERVDLAAEGDTLAVCKELQEELDARREKLPGSLCYDEVVRLDAAGSPVVFLVSRGNARQTLTQCVLILWNVAARMMDAHWRHSRKRVCRDFGRLHPLVVRQYTSALVHALQAIHEIGFCCGGLLVFAHNPWSQLSSSTILIGDDQKPCIAAVLPSFATMERFVRSGILADAAIAQATLRRPLSKNAQAQDIRSIAYLIAEMLTGRRARGAILMNPKLFLDSIGDGDQRMVAHMSFLQELLSAQTLTDNVLKHPFVLAQPRHQSQPEHNYDVEKDGDAVLQASAALQDQRRMLVALTKDELAKCQAQTQEATHQMRVWFRGFERQYGRKPSVDDRPPTIIRLQARCRGLADRIAMLSERLQTVNKSFYRAAQLVADEPVGTVAATTDSSVFLPDAMVIQIPKHGEMKTAVDRTGPRRSPAQNAFLNRHGT